MTIRQPDFDIDRAIGAQGELWVSSVRKALAAGRIEVKGPKPFLREQSFYVEYACRGRDGKWRLSGIATTKSEVLIFTFGELPGGLLIDREWCLRAARVAYKNPLNRKECKRGSNPTKAVAVSLAHLWITRPGEP
jgi:hypothetical protein